MAKKATEQKPKTATVTEQPARTNYKLLLGGIILLTALLYSNCLHNDILNFDDNEYFSMYPEVTNLSWDSVKKIFSSYYLIMYQPLPVLTFAINYEMTGLDPMPIHLLNVCLHLVNIALVFQLIKQLTEKQNLALIVALLFALHPLNVEAISWMSARSSSMYVCFYLLSLIYYVKYLKQDLKPKFILLAGLFFIISLFSKAQAVTLPVVMLLLDYYHHRKLNARLILEKIPFFALSVVFGSITLMDSDTQNNLTNGMLGTYNVVDKFFLVCYSFSFYFVKLLLPINLCSVYVFPTKVNGMLPWEYYASSVIFLGILYLLFHFRKNRMIVFGLMLFFITISINIQIIPSRLFITTDRYAYFPYIGLFFIIGYIYNNIQKDAALSKKYGNAFNVIIGILCVFFAYTIWERNKIWNNDEVFLTDIIEKNEHIPYLSRAYGNRGNYYLNRGMFQQAIADFTEAIAVKKDDGQSYYNRGLTYIKMNMFREAHADLDTCLKYNPDFALAYSNRAFVKYNLKDFPGAMTDCNAALKINSKIPEAYNLRAALEFNTKDYPAVERDLNMAISLKKDFYDAYKNRGLLYLNTNRKSLACSDFQTAKLNGDPSVEALMKQACQ